MFVALLSFLLCMGGEIGSVLGTDNETCDCDFRGQIKSGEWNTNPLINMCDCPPAGVTSCKIIVSTHHAIPTG